MHTKYKMLMEREGLEKEGSITIEIIEVITENSSTMLCKEEKK